MEKVEVRSYSFRYMLLVLLPMPQSDVGVCTLPHAGLDAQIFKFFICFPALIKRSAVPGVLASLLELLPQQPSMFQVKIHPKRNTRKQEE